jgi:probable blue pigment (indigoidine) exporter
VAIVGLINPVVGTVLGVLFAGELFGWAQALGMVLVLGGVVAGQRLAVRPRRPTVRRLETTARMTLRERQECRAA